MTDRDHIIDTARQLDAETLKRAATTYRYQSTGDPQLAAAIDILSAHGRADELSGDLARGRYGARVRRYVLWGDTRRVVALQTFATERTASRTLELGGLYLAGNTERGSEGVRVGRHVLWGDTLQPYANDQSASGALWFGLVPGAVKETSGAPTPRPRTWRSVTVIRRGWRASRRRLIWFQPRIKDPNLWCELYVGPIILIRFRGARSADPRPRITVAAAGSPAAVRAERRLRAMAATDPLAREALARRRVPHVGARQSNGRPRR